MELAASIDAAPGAQKFFLRAHASARQYFDLVGGTTGRPPDVEEGALAFPAAYSLVPAEQLLPLAEFTSKHEFLHQAQRRFTTVVHNRNWRDLAEELAAEGSAGSRSAPRGKKGKAQAKGRERAKHAAWREAVRFVAASQDGAGAFLNAIPMRDDMRMETWAMRISVQRRLGLPLDAACQAAAPSTRIAIEVDGPFHFLLPDGRGVRRPNGPTLLKRRLLAAAGWRVISVPFFEWDALPTASERQTYLERAVALSE
ncbi:hypothetical protein EMIHUDRAFT_232078 [Emiliania huxleyi CCMP1516]|uniref:RAP domain-containing protein n=2 Tax=Emiliania huxleyi TaxID=2903 RepID=A0A0D3K6C2_EMIH1|nr:hypothetical protein EMIHUDRAFT_232078 [Emiliania huxleyi CCMP1516]EOD31307.1 hypothetical protein EMIHUDRAFT_232078 [Emiliania huxleyi CCMP1516]|eukprot:XP_005783736.1 hypothetical protein EMIHUDRAFT_232078 [Emiliania huxleyi CCMP1516]